MFGSSDQALTHKSVGELEADGTLRTKKPRIIKLWEKEYTVRFCFEDDGSGRLSPEQEKAAYRISEEFSGIKTDVEERISSMLKTTDPDTLANIAECNARMDFLRDGRCVLPFRVYMDEDELKECGIAADGEAAIELF